MNIIRKETAKVRAEGAQHRPRSGQTAGTRVLDYAALGKAILLCSSCSHKFDAARYGYVTNSKLPFAIARCDGCENVNGRCCVHLKGG
jgi:hypothetical protein